MLPEVECKRLDSLKVSGWRQFENVEITFHPRLTIITGANGAGKSTLLHLLSPMFGWDIPFASVPPVIRRAFAFATSVWRKISGTVQSAPSSTFSDELEVGQIALDDLTASITIPSQATIHTYSASLFPKVKLAGLFIPSHRPVFTPSTLRIPSSPYSMSDAHKHYIDAVRAPWSPEVHSDRTPLQVLAETLVSWNERGDTSHHAAFDAFSLALQKLLPASLGFRNLSTRLSEVVLETDTGDFTLDAVSGGTAAVIDLGWQVFSYAGAHPGPFVVVIDEPENHLHPEMQRNILPNFLETFKDIQLVIASHAPLVITSVKDSEVYALMYNDRSSPYENAAYETETEWSLQESAAFSEIMEAQSVTGSAHALVSVTRRRAIAEAKKLADFAKTELSGQSDRVFAAVFATRLDLESKSGTANDVLRDVLGLDYTMPVWASVALDEAVTDVAAARYSHDAIMALDENLQRRGVGQYGVETLRRMQERAKGAAPKADGFS